MVAKETVKLVSKEGFDFVVDYQAACASNTIKNMLSSQGARAPSPPPSGTPGPGPARSWTRRGAPPPPRRRGWGRAGAAGPGWRSRSRSNSMTVPSTAAGGLMVASGAWACVGSSSTAPGLTCAILTFASGSLQSCRQYPTFRP